ncbi:MAG: HDIG domain-containing metalloprotein [Thermodesulfobacteriota bacterium]
MEKTDKEAKKKAPKISRLGETRKVTFREYLTKAWDYFLSLLKEKFVLLFFLCLFLALINAPGLFIPTPTFQVGDVAGYTVKASRDMLLEDQAVTEQKRQEAAQSGLAVYDFDEKIHLELQKKIGEGFKKQREALKNPLPPNGQKKTDDRSLLEKTWGIEITPGEFALLSKSRFSEIFEGALKQLVQSVMAVGVVNDKLTLMGNQGKGIIVRRIPSNLEFRIRDIERFPDLDEARDRLEKRSAYLLVGKSREFRPVAVSLSQKMILPNLSLNKAETEDRIRKAVQEVRPVLFQVKRGEILVQAGETINESHLLKLRKNLSQKKGIGVLWASLGLALVWGLFVFMVYLAAERGKFGLNPITANLRDLIFLSSLLAVSVLSIKTMDFLAQSLSGGQTPIPSQAFIYALPITAAPMMISMVLGSLPAFVFALVQAFLAITFWEGNPEAAIYFALAGSWASLAHGVCHNRWDLFRMGFFLGLIQMAAILAFQVFQGRLLFGETLINLFSGFLGGILAGIIVTGFSPLIEKIFGYTTEMKLLERANMDQPLLKELMVQAPGTYHHSVIVGNMVEAAAEAIGANALLARVSAYYHDIGKIQKPQYFVENQMGGENKHEKLAPSMSALILIAHIKDGVEMAQQQKLDPPIIDIIRQHHGTGLISFFYQKALDLRGGEVTQVSMEDFRYPGPKPQTREAGLVLLADGIEAASRTLVDPTPARIRGLVQKIIQNAFSDGQLDECDLTLKDLSQISASFSKILTGIFHHRIEYPEPTLRSGGNRKKPDGDTDKQPPELDRPNKDLENLLANLKGLGTF